MTRTERDLMLLFGLYVLTRDARTPTLNDRLQQSGARLYDTLHDDEGHVKDLPGVRLTRDAILVIAKLAGFPDPKLATAIALAESGGWTNALARSSREHSVGLWQINTKVHPYTPSEMAEPMRNAAAAYKISRGGTDWRPWGAFTNGSYKQFKTGVLA